MKNQPKRRIQECFLCEEVVRSRPMHKMYYTGPDRRMKGSDFRAQLRDEEVYVCDRCFVKVGYILKGQLELDTMMAWGPVEERLPVGKDAQEGDTASDE